MSLGMPVSIDTIFDRVSCDDARQKTGVPAGACQLGRTRASLAKAWGVLNKWALENLSERGTIDVPNFMRAGWQRFRSMDGKMRLRPVFILSEGFCRAHGLPHNRILQPPLFKKPAEVVNHTKLAIRYTSSMTKDMVYGALREIIRGIGEAMATGAQVNVAFSFGALEARDRKFRFAFDPAALCGEESAISRLDASNREIGVLDARKELDWLATSRSSKASSNLTTRSSGCSVTSSDAAAWHEGEEETATQQMYTARNENANTRETPSTSPKLRNADVLSLDPERHDVARVVGGPADGNDEEEEEEDVETQRAREVAAGWGRTRGSGKKTKLQEQVWEYAFRDHVTALEGQAEDDQTLKVQRRELQLKEERRLAEERDNKQREMRDLLTFVQGQIHELDARRAQELESNRGGDRPLTFSARRDRARAANECFEGTAWRAPDWGPRRALARNLSREELLCSLQCQIREREQERVQKNRRRLVEEKAAIEQTDREYDIKEEQKRGLREEALQELKRSWERHVHLKKLRELSKAGPAAIREYALSQNIIGEKGPPAVTTTTALAGRGRGRKDRAGWIEPGPKAITGPSKVFVKGLCRYRSRANGDGGGAEAPRERRPSTACSEATSSVGFDSRRSARGG